MTCSLAASRFSLITLLFLIVLSGRLTHAQTPPDTSDAAPDVESVLDDLEADDGDAAQLVELLTELAAHPLDVNTASAAELSLIPSFSPALATRIVRYRTRNGPFGSLPELQNVPGLASDHAQRARPYLRIGDAHPPSDASASSAPSLAALLNDVDVDLIQRITRRLDLGRGYDDDTTRTTFLGSPERLYTRLRIRHGRHVRLGLMLDKDPGEPFQWDPSTSTYGYDHVSAHLALQDIGRIERLIIGDFSAAFGQGVTLWRSMAFGKGRDPVSPIARSGRGLAPFASTEENQFFRGTAATVRLTPSLSVSALASRRTLDASVDSTFGLSPAEDGAPMAISRPETGLHRTLTELDRKDALRETVAGGGLEYIHSLVRLGVVGYQSRFDPPIAPGARADQRFDWTGATASMLGLYANIFAGNFHLFGEAARSPSGTFGGTGGLEVDLSPGLHALVMGRYYPRSFSSPYGHAFGERNGATQNEMGLYLGLRLRLHSDWRVAAYVDQYRFPWLRFGVPRPSAGHEARLVIEHEPRPWLSHYVQIRSETREVGTDVAISSGRVLNGVRPETRQSIRWHGQYAFSDALHLQTRLEWSRFKDTASDVHVGTLLYQDVRWRPLKRIRLDGRLSFFDTEGFAARIYTYEHDLLYAFAIPVFFGRGQRKYLLATLKPTSTLDLQIKYSVTTFQNVREVGSGLNTTPGNRLREIGIQVRVRL